MVPTWKLCLAWKTSCGAYYKSSREDGLVEFYHCQISNVIFHMKWKILKSEYLFKDTWFTVRRDTCERPDGKIVFPYYVYEFPTWVTSLALMADGRVILEKQYRHAIGETAFEIPGGCVDATDKSLEDAIARELMEETGCAFD